ncbi:glycoside hydrolase family 43 protein [Pedobacter sp. MC2016-05]|uniref:glycoside hydrolase family 43 protein n=1 Tax=Pedobacter sp. MC2016-05 TaxID=2994474 RepID=UPI0022481496|nr:glycoside hydrolase family 43 protein [Pedobacter sp. MC2016-05]MCX2476678.1 glycoside hydrolase family 43 protein [Pedobacter sp. MC2016-05]
MLLNLKKVFTIFLVLFLPLIFHHAFAQQRYNNFKPGKIWEDNKGKHINAHGGGVTEIDGVYYWYGEHKVAGNIGNTAQVGVHCYSSKDLYNWKDEGIALKVSDDLSSDIAKGCILERPKVVFNKRTKKFVMWFHLELLGKGYEAARAGVAIADRASGPFLFARSYRPNPNKLPVYPNAESQKQAVNCSSPANKSDGFFCRDMPGGQMARDMTVYVDDDGKAYHIFSSEENFTLHLAELSDDYLSHTGKFIRIYIGQQTEAPALFKKDGKYYMVGSGCTGWAPNPARWFVADSIWGPWKYMGNPCIGEGSALTFGGQSTHIFKAPGTKNQFIFMADQWTPKNPIDGKYLWLPIDFNEGKMEISWNDRWDLSVWKK